jgi:AcrR family transcriptional regulator
MGPPTVRESAVHLFAEQGYNATTMRDIARRASLTPGALYHHYESKEALLLEIMEQGMQKLMRSATAELAAAGSDPEQRLRALVRAHVAVHGEHREEAVVADTELRALSAESRDAIQPIRDEYEVLWRQAIEDLAAGQLTLDHSLVRFAIIQMCTGVAHWYRPEGPLSLDKITDQFGDIAVRMVAPLTPGGRNVG